MTFATHHADLGSNQVTESVKPPDISLKVGGFLFLVTEAGLLISHTPTSTETVTERDRQTGREKVIIGNVNILVMFLIQLNSWQMDSKFIDQKSCLHGVFT